METGAHVTRRAALALGASAVGVALVAGPLGPVASAAARATTGSAATATTGLRRDHWTGLVGRTVTVQGPSGNVAATVVRVEDLQRTPARDATRFSVELRTDRRKVDLAGVRPVVIPNRGTATLLIAAVDRGARYRTYQIVVNNPPR